MDKYLQKKAIESAVGRHRPSEASSESDDDEPDKTAQSTNVNIAGSSREKNESDSDDNTNAFGPSAKKLCPNRKYDDGYLKYGFMCTGTDALQKPQCVVCSEVLANASMKPSKLMRHFRTKHPDLSKKPIEFFQRKRDELKKQQTQFVKRSKLNSAALRASFDVALRIAKAKKPHTIAEDLILPCAIDIVRSVCGETLANNVRSVPLSNNTIGRRIEDMSADIREQLISQLKSSKKFALQLDESTDVANCAMLLVYVRFVREHERTVCEEFLFCDELPTRTTGEEIFNIVNRFVTQNGLEWTNCIGITTDGAAAMTGVRAGLVQRIKNVAGPGAVSYHCFIHREALASKELGEDLHEVLNSAVRMINFIKASALNTRMFEVLCAEMGSEHVHLLLHTEVRWLSRGKVLQRLLELREEVHTFLNSKNSSLAEKLDDQHWVAKLSYLVDIFGFLNDLNLGLQGRDSDLFRHMDMINAFVKKLQHWRLRVGQGRMDMFSCLTDVCNSDTSDADAVSAAILPIISHHLDLLITKFNQYFPNQERDDIEWVRNPFVVDIEKLSLSADDESKLIELSCDRNLKAKFQEVRLSDFWLHVSTEYPTLSDAATAVLLPFTTTYLCEAGFSAMTAMKTKYRNRLNVSDDLRLCLSSIAPNIDRLVNRMQAHPSH